MDTTHSPKDLFLQAAITDLAYGEQLVADVFQNAPPHIRQYSEARFQNTENPLAYTTFLGALDIFRNNPTAREKKRLATQLNPLYEITRKLWDVDIDRLAQCTHQHLSSLLSDPSNNLIILPTARPFPKKDEPHPPKDLLIAKMGFEIDRAARGSLTEGMTTEQIKESLQHSLRKLNCPTDKEIPQKLNKNIRDNFNEWISDLKSEFLDPVLKDWLWHNRDTFINCYISHAQNHLVPCTNSFTLYKAAAELDLSQIKPIAPEPPSPPKKVIYLAEHARRTTSPQQ